MSASPAALPTRWNWNDTPGDDPEAVALALPLLGIAGGLDADVRCVLPRCGFGTTARVSSRELLYRCPACQGERKLRLVDMYAARLMHQRVAFLSPALAVAWWGHLWVKAGVLSVDLPRVEVDLTCRNRRVVEEVLRGFVLLQAIHSEGGTRRPLPSDFTREFASAWCGVSLPAAARSLTTLADGGYVTRDMVKPKGGRERYRYDLTGKGLVIERPEHASILPALSGTLPVPDAPPE